MVRTPMCRSAAMFARFFTSWGASSWDRPWRERKATGIGLPVVGDLWVVRPALRGPLKRVQSEQGMAVGQVGAGEQQGAGGVVGTERRQPFTGTKLLSVRYFSVRSPPLPLPDRIVIRANQEFR